MYLLTQVSEDRVQVICKLSTQVNKGRVQVRLEPGSTRTGYTLQQGKPVLKTGKLLTKDIQVLQPGKHTVQPRKPVFQVGIGNIGQDTAKYQVSSIKE